MKRFLIRSSAAAIICFATGKTSFEQMTIFLLCVIFGELSDLNRKYNNG